MRNVEESPLIGLCAQRPQSPCNRLRSRRRIVADCARAWVIAQSGGVQRVRVWAQSSWFPASSDTTKLHFDVCTAIKAACNAFHVIGPYASMADHAVGR